MNHLNLSHFSFVNVKRLASIALVASTLSASLSVVSASILPQSASARCNCTSYLGKGYCTDYIRTKLGNKTPKGNAKNFPTNTKEPTPNSVAVFKWKTYGHVAWVESVDKKNKTFTVSHWNYSSVDVNSCCAVTSNFGKRTTNVFKFDNKDIAGFYIAK